MVTPYDKLIVRCFRPHNKSRFLNLLSGAGTERMFTSARLNEARKENLTRNLSACLVDSGLCDDDTLKNIDHIRVFLVIYIFCFASQSPYQ